MRILLVLALLYIAFVALKGLEGYIFLSDQRKKKEAAGQGKMVQDPVCEMYIPMDRAIEKHGEKGPVYFCSEKCAGTYLKKG